jgi:hypothetical protein
MNIPLDLLRERMIGGRTGDDREHDAPAYRTATHGHGKVFIIDEAELLDRYAQNALLKTLEEPPRDTYMFLITSRPERLLPTVRSRCQHVRFGPLDDDAMERWRARANPELQGDGWDWIRSFSDGSPGMALLAVEYGFHRWQGILQPMIRGLAHGTFPVSMGETMADLIEEYASAWVKNHENASKDAANKDGVRHLLTLLASEARRFMRDPQAKRDEILVWADVIRLVRDAELQSEANVNLKQLLENLAVQWARRTSRAAVAS